jgi:hypothetical protein
MPTGVYEALAKHVEKVAGLELSHLLGKGGFGSVYFGVWGFMLRVVGVGQARRL